MVRDDGKKELQRPAAKWLANKYLFGEGKQNSCCVFSPFPLLHLPI